jgi:biotin carboxyl carrier protein
VKLTVQIGERTRTVEMSGADSGNDLRGMLDGTPFSADALEVSAGIYSILMEGRAFEVRVEPQAGKLRIEVAGAQFLAEVRDPRQWTRHSGGAASTEGRQQVIAPMPGKVVRVLVKSGDTVEAGQGLLVVEAMKMQNEIRAPKSGTVERLTAQEGQTVNPGDILVIIN